MPSFIRLSSRTAMFGLALSLAATAPVLAATRDEADQKHARALSNAFRTAARKLDPSVVSIVSIDKPPYSADSNGGQGGPQMPEIPEEFRRFFPNMPGMPNAPQQRGGRMPPRMGEGTGVIVDKTGVIVTNNHVIRGADELKVVLHDGREVAATVIGADRDTDLAVIQVEATDLVAASFGDSESLEVGDWVVAIGCPFGLDHTVTAGIISAKGRDRVGLATFENYIQTDAAINPGNSGGPLADLEGNVIGINTAISSRNGGNDGVGFAIPSSMVKEIVGQLRDGGRVVRGYLGVQLQEMDAETASSFDIKPSDGVLIARVQPDTPAQKAGLQDGDIVVKIDGKPTPSTAAFMRIIASRRPDAEVNLEIIREGERMTKQATLIERTTERVNAGAPALPQRSEELARLGLTVEQADADMLKSMNLEQGVVIASIKDDSPAAERGLQAGDVITKVNGRDVRDADSMRDAVSAVPEGRPLRLTVVRDGEQRFVILRR
ncbi:MAG: PDZ domain-containing protein [Planctomycetes bacterium]|nr:PDZ domain-containing protein [Planctomycetota bacterium]